MTQTSQAANLSLRQTMEQHPQDIVMQSHEPTHWRADLERATTRNDGWTPYIDLDEFEPVAEIREVYRDDEDVDRKTVFESVEDAVAWRNEQIKYHVEDDTLPKTEEERKAIVKLLFKAFKSVARSRDNKSMKDLFLNPAHDNARVEVVCWIMLDAAENRSRNGPLLQGFKPKNAKENTHRLNFEQRINQMVTSLSEEKTICKHLMDAPYVMTFVDDPVHARRRTESNRDLNKKKGTIMAAGKKATGLDKPKVTRRATKLKARRRRQQASEESEEGSDRDQSSSSPFNATPDTINNTPATVNSSPGQNMSPANTFNGSRSNASMVGLATPSTISNTRIKPRGKSTAISPLASHGESSRQTMRTPGTPMAAPEFMTRAYNMPALSSALDALNGGNGRTQNGRASGQLGPVGFSPMQERGGNELIQNAGVRLAYSPGWYSSQVAPAYSQYGTSAQLPTTRGYGFPEVPAFPGFPPSMGQNFSQRTTPSPTLTPFGSGFLQHAMPLPDTNLTQTLNYQHVKSSPLTTQLSGLAFSPDPGFNTLTQPYDASLGMNMDLTDMITTSSALQSSMPNSMIQQPLMHQRHQACQTTASDIYGDSSTSSSVSFGNFLDEDLL